jgi:hypothetical protein
LIPGVTARAGSPRAVPSFPRPHPKEKTMKDIAKKDVPGVSGGYSPDDGCFPNFPLPEYPPNPIGPWPEPLPSPIDPQPFVPVK